MTPEDFQTVFDEQVNRCSNLLIHKATEYAPDLDRLHNFRIAAHLEGVELRQALAGMMAKHTISLYDMCAARNQIEFYLWEEKITDHINYLFLLKAIIVEEHDAYERLDATRIPVINGTHINRRATKTGLDNA